MKGELPIYKWFFTASVAIALYWFLTSLVPDRRNIKYRTQGTNRQHQSRLDHQLEKTLQSSVPRRIVNLLHRAGIETLSEPILTIGVWYGLILLVLIIAWSWFISHSWFLVMVLFLLVLPIYHVVDRVNRFEREMILHTPIFIMAISREFSRTRDIEQAFQKAAQESTGRSRYVFTKMVAHTNAVRGDVEGALAIFQSLFPHTLADQMVLAIKQGLATNRLTQSLGSVVKQALLEKRLIEQKDAKRKDSFIFLNATMLFLVILLQVGYYAFSNFSLSGL